VTSWRWTVGRKVTAVSVAGLSVATLIGGISVIGVRQIGAVTGGRNQIVATDQAVTRLDTKLSDVSVDEREAILSYTPDTAATVHQKYDGDVQEISQTMARVEQAKLSPTLTERLSALRRSYLAYLDQTTQKLPALLALPPTSAASTTAVASEADRSASLAAQIDDARQALGQAATTSEDALTAQIRTVEVTVVLALVTGLVSLVLLSTWITRLITRPISEMVTALRRLADRDVTVQVRTRGRDEVAEMSIALNRAVSSVRETVTTLADSSATLTSASQQLAGVSTTMGVSAGRTADQTDTISATAQEVADSAGSMSAATEQMTASIGEIADQATRASAVAGEAVRTAQQTSQAVGQLGQASTEISEIVKVITSIAEQTNLLALNATIEAARAGEAGKGFAVVATEVKELAQETSRATDDITSKIAGIQSTTAQAIDAIGRISHVIDQINENQATIAAAVEEQTATTSDISRSVSAVSSGSTNIAGLIGGIAESAASTSSGAGATQRSADELARLSEKIQDLVRLFTY